MTHSLNQQELRIDLATGASEVRPVSYKESGIIGPVDYGWRRCKEDPDSFTFGEGLLASSTIPGSRRLVFCSISPQWENFYISTMGGAAYTFQHLGVNYAWLRGRSKEPSLLALNRKEGEISVRLEPLPDYREVWQGYPNPDGEKEVGIFALQQAIFERYAGEYPPRKVRMFVVGPAALETPEGAIGSNTIKKGKLTPVVDWCGRGGMGSRLLQHHNVVGCIFGGDWVDPERPKTKETDIYFIDHFGDKTAKVDQKVTTKYRYDPKLRTGGTFGANLHNIRDRLLTFNYRSTYATEEERLRLHKNFIAGHYLKQFNEETIESKNFDHCGEPCATACKKLHGRYKKDYEPYHALGPQLGVFDQRAAEILNDHADAMGFDAIQLGGTLAWIMECVADGLIPPEDFGFPPASDMNFQFASEHEQFDVVNDSMHNSRYAMALIDAILNDQRAALFRKGIRAAAYALDEKYGANTLDRAVFLAHGEHGYMVPNQYWVPGMGSPMPVMGKYYVYYGQEFLDPAALGRKNVERMVYELMTDNLGLCRFHRTWAESVTDEIVIDRFGLDMDFKAHHFEMARAINADDSGKRVPWETGRMADMLFNYIRYWGDAGVEDQSLATWDSHIVKDKNIAAQAFWQAILNGQEAAFRSGAAAIPDALTPAQKEQRTTAQTSSATT
ncbi:MAG: aldehyde ferredoxin oxidoreductase N-terminal domain-containing protein [Pseudomonadota bacterium]|nr:aldehyde ferredoxin oxidoreductase N-terminal domain-containing protein [Pseudomonadota bacterium]